jgi:hypothetical protein
MDARVLDLVKRRRRADAPDRAGRREETARSLAPLHGRAVAGELVVDITVGMPSGPADGQQRDLLGDGRREEMRLAIRAEAGEARIGQARLAAGGGSGMASGRRVDGAARSEIGEGSSARARPRPSGSSGRRPSASGRRRRSAHRRCTTRWR